MEPDRSWCLWFRPLPVGVYILRSQAAEDPGEGSQRRITRRREVYFGDTGVSKLAHKLIGGHGLPLPLHLSIGSHGQLRQRIASDRAAARCVICKFQVVDWQQTGGQHKEHQEDEDDVDQGRDPYRDRATRPWFNQLHGRIADPGQLYSGRARPRLPRCEAAVQEPGSLLHQRPGSVPAQYAESKPGYC